jgi:hypothetical protein
VQTKGLSTPAGSNKPHTGADGNNRRLRFGEENGKIGPTELPIRLGLPVGEKRASCFQRLFEGSGSPGKAEGCWFNA